MYGFWMGDPARSFLSVYNHLIVWNEIKGFRDLVDLLSEAVVLVTVGFNDNLELPLRSAFILKLPGRDHEKCIAQPFSVQSASTV
jgi:hypothetical protein